MFFGLVGATVVLAGVVRLVVALGTPGFGGGEGVGVVLVLCGGWILYAGADAAIW